MAKKAARWGQHREKIIEKSDAILTMKSKGRPISVIRVDLDMEDIPLSTFHYNVARLPGWNAEVRSRETLDETEKVQPEKTPASSSATQASDTKDRADKALAVKPASGGNAPRLKKKKRKFVSVTVGGNLDDELNPSKWREQREAREEEERLAKEKEEREAKEQEEQTSSTEPSEPTDTTRKRRKKPYIHPDFEMPQGRDAKPKWGTKTLKPEDYI